MVANAVRRIKAQHRLKAIWALAKDKKICEPDELDEKDNGDATFEDEYLQEQKAALKGHGGCGHEQPVWRKKGLKLMGVWKPTDKGEVSLFSLFHPRVILNVSRMRLLNQRNAMFLQGKFTTSLKRSLPRICTSWVSMPTMSGPIG